MIYFILYDTIFLHIDNNNLKNKNKMIEKIKKQENNIISTIKDIKSNKNPLAIIFEFTKIREIFLSIWESLLSWIELNYSKSARQKYLDIVSEYKKSGLYEITYNHYINTKGLSRFQKAIDNYFEHSFFTDLSFFYFAVSKDDRYNCIFKILNTFKYDKKVLEKYLQIEDYFEKRDYIISIISDFSLLYTDKQKHFVIKFIDNFSWFDFDNIVFENNSSDFKYLDTIKNITLFVLKNKTKYQEIYSLIIKTFVDDPCIYHNIIWNLEEQKIFEIISYLRKELISWVNTQTTLDVKSKKTINEYANIAYKIQERDIEDKVSYLLNIETILLNMSDINWKYARLYLKKLLLENKYPQIIDLTLWITALPQEVYYLFKEKTQNIDLDWLKIYSEIKDLILYIDKSFFLNLSRPFLLKKISHYFNNSDQKYYIIKFILCVISSDSYSEYKRISRFFYNLETFSRNTFEARLWKILQYWWLYLLGLLFLFIAPAWVLFAWFIILIKEVIMKIISKLKPEIKMNFNFQIWSFAWALWIIALVLGWTVWYKDNINLAYNNFKWFVNAITLPANESLKLIAWDLSKLTSNVLWNDFIWNKNTLSLKDIDYSKGIWLYEIKNPSSDLWEYTHKEVIGIDKKQQYKSVRIDRYNTFWDYWVEISISCWFDINDTRFNRNLTNNIQTFLEKNRRELLTYIPYSKERLSVWSIASRLPVIDFDLRGLYEVICKKSEK